MTWVLEVQRIDRETRRSETLTLGTVCVCVGVCVCVCGGGINSTLYSNLRANLKRLHNYCVLTTMNQAAAVTWLVVC